jgi:hypothetical protein
MAMYDAQGSKFYVGPGGSPDAPDQVLQVRRISDPQFSRPWKDRTDLDSTWREGKPGMPEIGEMSVEVFWDGDAGQQHNTLRDAFLNNTQKNFKITWPDGNQVVFDGYVVSIGGTEEVDGDLVRTITVHGDGVPSWG